MWLLFVEGLIIKRLRAMLAGFGIKGQKFVLKMKGHAKSFQLYNEYSAWIWSVTLLRYTENFPCLFLILYIFDTVLCSITSIHPQSPNPNHSGADLTTTASLKLKHDQHYLHKDQQQQQQQVCPRWLRGTLQNRKSVFFSLISSDRGQESQWTQKTDKQVHRVK